MTNQEISALSIWDKEYIPFLSAEKICYLQEPDLIQCLDPAQIEAVTANQVLHLLDSQIRFLTMPEQIQQVHQRQLGSLLPWQLRHLALSQIMYLPDKKIQYLEKRLLQQINGQRICQLYQAQNILPSQLKELSKTQLKALLQENDIREILPHLDNEQLKYIEKKEQIRAIPAYFVQYLTTNQYSALTPEQSTQIPDQHYKHLNEVQFKHKYKKHSGTFLLLKGGALGSLRVLAYISGIYILKRITFFRFLGTITNALDRSNIYLGIGYRILQGK